MKEQSEHKIEVRLGLRMPKRPYNNLFFDHIDCFEFSSTLCVLILSYLPLLPEGTSAEVPALGSDHNCPCCRAKEC